MTPELNGSGIAYPTLELGGVVYVIKFTRGGLLYRLSRSGANLAELATSKGFATAIDVLHAALFGQFSGTSEELAELVVSENKIDQVSEVLRTALGKAFPPTHAIAAGTADQSAAPVQ